MKPPVIKGMIEPAEGERLAKLAAQVPRGDAIVEIGSHTGLSTVWLGRGSRWGLGAHVTAIDPWGDPRPGSRDDPLGLGPGDSVLATFLSNMASEDVADMVTPLRGPSVEVARMWVQPIGLLFIDAVHEYAHVLADYEAWAPHVTGWLAFHDYWNDPAYTIEGDTARVIRDVVLPSEQWSEPTLIANLWTARRR